MLSWCSLRQRRRFAISRWRIQVTLENREVKLILLKSIAFAFIGRFLQKQMVPIVIQIASLKQAQTSYPFDFKEENTRRLMQRIFKIVKRDSFKETKFTHKKNTEEEGQCFVMGTFDIKAEREIEEQINTFRISSVFL